MDLKFLLVMELGVIALFVGLVLTLSSGRYFDEDEQLVLKWLGGGAVSAGAFILLFWWKPFLAESNLFRLVSLFVPAVSTLLFLVHFSHRFFLLLFPSFPWGRRGRE